MEQLNGTVTLLLQVNSCTEIVVYIGIANREKEVFGLVQVVAGNL